MSLEYLREKLNVKQKRVKLRYDYYEQKNLHDDPSPVISQRDLYNYKSTLGWCTKAVDNLADRLSFAGFEQDDLNAWSIFKMNSKDIFFDSAIRSALISSCSFVYISVGDDEEIRLQVIDGKNATGNIDPRTFILTEGYAILDRDEMGTPTLEAYFTSEETVYIENGEPSYSIPNPTGYPLLVPIIYKPSDKRPFGHSRITRTCMDEMDQARFCLTRAAVTGEFGTIPQKYILGLSPDAEFDTLKNSYKAFLAIDKDIDGDKPVVGQFQQLSMAPHIDSFDMHVRNFAAETGLAPEDLGYHEGNSPTSSEAIKASHSELNRIAKKAQEYFSVGFVNVALVSASLRDETHYKRSIIADLVPVWNPIFEMDNAAMSSFGDGIIKISQAIPDAITPKLVKRMTGLPIEVGEE